MIEINKFKKMYDYYESQMKDKESVEELIDVDTEVGERLLEISKKFDIDLEKVASIVVTWAIKEMIEEERKKAE